MKIIAVIPVFNEATTLGRIIDETRKHVDEVIVVDDGSSDNSVEIAKSHGAVVVENIVNRGLGVTIQRGFSKAIERGADIIVQIDSDAQYDPAEIPLLIEPITSKRADFTLGTRMENLQYTMPALKKYGNKAFTALIRFLSGADIKDAQTGFRALRREVLETLNLKAKYTYTQEMIIQAAKEGWRIQNVPIRFYQRTSGESRLIPGPLTYATRAVLIIIKTIRDYYPLRFFASFGMLFILAGTLLGASLIYRYYLYGIVGKTPSVVLTSLLIISGVQLIFLGLLADMIKNR
jgi:glycosyltransferase involved in cell wall biosynthesis